MAAAGRKRNQQAERYPSGAVKHKKEDQSLLAKTSNPRIEAFNTLVTARHEAVRFLGDIRFSTELGKLHLKGKIVESERMAGEEWIKLVEDHRRICLDGVHTHPVTGSYERKSRGNGTQDYDEDMIKRIADQYDRIFCAIVDVGRTGILTMRAINRLCIENLSLSYQEFVLAKAGLKKMAVLFNLIGSGRMKN